MVPHVGLSCLAFLELIYVDWYPDVELKQRLQVHTFNLREQKVMRELNPSDIDQLVSIRGMIIRCSALVPDLKEGGL